MQCSGSPEEVIRSPRTLSRSDCGRPRVGARNQIWILYKSSMNIQPPSQSLQPYQFTFLNYHCMLKEGEKCCIYGQILFNIITKPIERILSRLTCSPKLLHSDVVDIFHHLQLRESIALFNTQGKLNL